MVPAGSNASKRINPSDSLDLQQIPSTILLVTTLKVTISAGFILLPWLALCQQFEVQSSRPYLKGEKFRVESLISAHDQIVRFQDQKGETNEQRRALSLTGLVHIVDVDAKGVPKEFKCLLESFKETEAGKVRVVVPGGQTLTVTGHTNQPTSFRLQEGDVMPVVEDRASFALGRIFMDEVITGPGPQKLGNEWSLDPKLFAKKLPENMVVESGAVTSAKLTGRTNLFGQECLSVQVTSSGRCAPTYALDAQMRKQGFEFHGAAFKMSYEGFLPTNLTVRPTFQRLTTFVAITNYVTGSSGKAGLVQVTETESATKMLPAAKEPASR
jgi:hypothetical protein